MTRDGFALVFVRTFTARAIAALGAFALLIVVGRVHGAAGVGVLGLAQATLFGAGVIGRGGMDNALMRYVGQDHASSHVSLYLRWALLKGGAAGLVLGALVFIARNPIARLFDASGLSDILLGISVAIPAYVLAFLLSGFFKGVRMPATACLMENGSVALFTALIIAGASWLGGDSSYAWVGWAHCGAAYLVVAQGSLQVWLWMQRRRVSGSDCVQISKVQFTASSRAFFVSTFAGFMQNVVAVMIAGALLSTSDLGLFKSAQQIGLLIAFVLIVINAIFPPKFAALYFRGDLAGLSRLSRQGVALGVAIAMPVFLVCIAAPEWVLHWLGDGFQQAAPLLRVIALAQLVNVATGSVGFLLNMTGHEKLMRNVALISNALGLIGFWLLIPLFGAIGAAYALAFVLVVQNLVALFYVWRMLGIWTLPLPNLFAIVGVPTLMVKGFGSDER